MDNRVEVGSIIGRNDAKHWAQTIKTRYVYGVLEVVDDEGIASRKGLSIIKKISDCCAKGVPGATSLRDVLASIQESVSLVLIVLAGQTAIMYVKGSGHSYIKRNGTLAKLLDEEGQVEGSIRKGDMFLLMTKNLGDVADESLVMTVFDHLPAEDVAEKLTTKIWMSAQEKSYAGIVVSVADCIDEGVPDAPISESPEEERNMGGVYERISQRESNKAYARIAWVKKNWRIFCHKMEDRTMRILVGIVLLILCCIGVGVYREIANRTSSEALTLIKSGEEKITEGDALLSMSPVKARIAFEEGKQFLSQAENSASKKSKDGRKVADLLKSLEVKLGEASRVFDVTPEMFFDVSLLKTGGAITTIAIEDDTLVALDRQMDTVYSITIPSKNGTVIGGPEYVSGAVTASLHGDLAYVLTDTGINAITMKTKTGTSGVVKKVPEWGDIRDMVAFGGNLYLLDVGKSRIWKYVATDIPSASGSATTKSIPGMTFTELREYLNPDTFPELSSSTSLSIDGFVWLGGVEGAVRKFVGGREETFTVSGVEPALADETRVYTDDTLTHLYILEAKTKRVVVVDKEGIYTAQYHFPDAFNPTSLAVSEKNGIILLLSDGKLYGIPIK